MVKIYNLCAEEGFNYTSDHVGGLAIGKYPFCDHNVSSIERILEFSADASLFLQRMEQFNKEREGKDAKQPAIVVHCKAGKGRTGMMICSLLVFISMFRSAEESIEHYNQSRVDNGKGLTISSQIRYVKFFEGFLTLELFLKRSIETIFPDPSENAPSWYELYLKDYNRILDSRILQENQKKQLKFACITLGPFALKATSIRICVYHWAESRCAKEEAIPPQEFK
jgi:hypothetical protein